MRAKLRRRRRQYACLAVALMISLTGCLVIPMNYYAGGSRRNLNLKSEQRLQPGGMTKEDVFCLLGEPDFASEDGTELGYSWRKVKAIWIIASQGGGASGEFKKSYLLHLTFDGSNRLARVETVRAWSEAGLTHKLESAQTGGGAQTRP